MGNREDPVNHPPWVRFEQAAAAQKCIEAMEKGEVENLGVLIRGVWRAADDKPSEGDFTSWTRPDLDLTARDVPAF